MSDAATVAFREKLSRVTAEDLPGGDRLIIRKSGTGAAKLYSVSLSSLNFSGKSTKSVEATSVKNLICCGVTPVSQMPVPSCHGYILLSHYDPTRIWAVWNPFTKQCIELPKYDKLTRGRYSSGGIGYDVVLRDFKVVRISGIEGVDVLETLIYSVKSGIWRAIEDYPNCSFLPFMNETEHGVFYNGELHWFRCIGHVGGEVGQILALDLGTEKYRQIPGPPVTSGDESMSASGGCLFMSYSYSEKFDIWMFNDQGGENIWTKFVSLSRLYDLGIYLVNPKLISYSKSKKLAVIQNEDNLLWYDVEGKCGSEVSIGGDCSSFSCQAFPTCQLNGSSNAKETTGSKGSLKRKRTIPKDSLVLKLKASTFQIPSNAGD